MIKWTMQELVYLTGSRKDVVRSIWADKNWGDDKKFFIRWYGKLIEVERSPYGRWRTVENY